MQKFLLNIAAFAARILPASFKQAIYNFKPLARLIRRGLNRAAPAGLTEVKVAAGDLAGYTILLDMQVDKDYWLGTYEPDIQSALHELIPAGAVIYDVGANIGYVSLLLAKAAGEGGKVFAFEALPSNVEQLRRNVELNGMERQVTVVAKAVTQAPGPVRFLVHASGGMGKAAGSAGRDDPYQSDVTVDGISLDEFTFGQGNPPPQVVKMDIEGGEVLALPGMRRLLAEARPLMLMELHGPESSRVAWETLTAARYEIRWMRKGFPVVPSLEAMGWKAYIVAKPKG
ncbi:MAG: FkbM family methyltransferase [Chloroflexi bacterium]|nr:FkbM family methyltransferase [Chloroflexota bacterium]